MSSANFPLSLSLVLVHEGGYVNDPRDSGGATNKGVTQAVYDDWRTRHGLPKQTVRAIGTDELEAVYRHGYWDAVAGDQLPAGVDYCMFDLAVNSGVNRAACFLQKAVRVLADGQIGPATIAAVTALPAGVIIDRICDERQEFLEGLSNFDHFGKGWTTRVKEVCVKAKEMV